MYANTHNKYIWTHTNINLLNCENFGYVKISSTPMWTRFLINDSIITTTTVTVTTTYIPANKVSPFYLTTLKYLNAFLSSPLLTWFPWKASNINWEDIFIPFSLVRRLSLTKSNILTLCPLHYITDKFNTIFSWSYF